MIVRTVPAEASLFRQVEGEPGQGAAEEIEGEEPRVEAFAGEADAEAA
jgi:hypothetical protein